MSTAAKGWVMVAVITIKRIRHACGVAFAEDLIGSQRAQSFHARIVENEGMCGMNALSDWQIERSVMRVGKGRRSRKRIR